MTLSDLIDQIGSCEAAIKVSDTAHYDDINNQLWDARRTMNMMASYLKPRKADEILFLHGLVDELITFIDDDPEYEDDKNSAIEAIRRININIRDYKRGTRAPAKLCNLFCLAQ